jgi:hypothetical protein
MINKMMFFIKTVVFIATIIILGSVISAFEPVVSSSIAVQQAYDTVESNAQMSIYHDLKKYTPIVWLLVGLLIYRREIKLLINKK